MIGYIRRRFSVPASGFRKSLWIYLRTAQRLGLTQRCPDPRKCSDCLSAVSTPGSAQIDSALSWSRTVLRLTQRCPTSNSVHNNSEQCPNPGLLLRLLLLCPLLLLLVVVSWVTLLLLLLWVFLPLNIFYAFFRFRFLAPFRHCSYCFWRLVQNQANGFENKLLNYVTYAVQEFLTNSPCSKDVSLTMDRLISKQPLL